MQVHCRSCRAMIPAENVNIQNMVAKCDECHAVFGVTAADAPLPPVGALAGAMRDHGGPAGPFPMAMPGGPRGFQAVSRGQVAMPGGMSVEHDGQDLLVRRGWFEWSVFLFVLVAAVMIAVASAVLFNPDFVRQLTGAGVMMTAVPAIFLAIGICMAYYCAACFVNTTTIRVGRQELSVVHAPLPWMGNYVYPLSDVAQLYCVEQVHRGKKGRVSFTYDVEIVFRNNLRQPLVTGLADVTQALYIEQEIERYLGLADAQVAGEVRRW